MTDDEPTRVADGGDEASPPHRRPRIDLTPALHEAGHEVADLGLEGVPDTGPVVTHHDTAREAPGVDGDPEADVAMEWPAD
ncbi:MAG: hypothetical protein IPM45_11245 [Acidimicrobiales bacterium]|nr:hypothetical protein [Acidimicrobiales bacterium]